MTILTDFGGQGATYAGGPAECARALEDILKLLGNVLHALLPAFGRGRWMTGSAAKRWTLCVCVCV